ncbi:hypothetical protein ATY78_25895 [Rhizobium sp. R635]|nr:hypothetical protein ATY78_25895 [Rhizobium sp. R635]
MREERWSPLAISKGEASAVEWKSNAERVLRKALFGLIYKFNLKYKLGFACLGFHYESLI